MGKKEAHLQIIQGVINRLSHNSFLLKGWSVVLISAMLGLAANTTNILYVYLAYFPALAFWGLDGFFLWHERRFRKLYDHVRTLREAKVDFSMDTSFAKPDVARLLKTTLSDTLCVFHGTVLVVLIIVTIAAAIARQQG